MDDRSELLARLRAASSVLPGVDEKKMFGCEAMFANGAIFALVWKTGRIGVKLVSGERYDALAREKGTDPWQAGNKTMAGWLLVSPAIAKDPKRLAAFKGKLVDQICEASGGPCKYTGKNMKDAHMGMNISGADFNALVEDLVGALDKFKVPAHEKDQLLGALGPMKTDIVEKK